MFLEYNECKTKHLFLIKKIAARFDEKIATWQKKSVDDPREESITADPEEDYHWGLKEDSIIENTKENPINEKPKENTIIVTPVDNTINENPKELQEPQWLLRRKLTLFGFLVMVCDRVGDGDEVPKENFGLERPRFHATSLWKIEAKALYRKR